MDLNIKIKCFLILSIQIILVKSSFDMTEYYKMPPLYEIEDFDRCLENTKDESLFCIVISEIVPNNSIPLWNQVKTFNSFNKINYHHDKLVNGVCVNRCKDILKLPEIEQKKLYAGKLTDLELNTHINNAYSSENGKRLKYNKLINQCLNYNFVKKYNLKLRSNIEYCVSNKDTLQIEFLDVVFCGIIGLILLLTIASSYYDYKLKQKLPDDEEKKQHYKMSVTGKRKLAYLSFSICRNYYRLVAPSKNQSRFAKDLRFFEAFRVFMMLGVITNHTIIGLNSIGFANPQYLETLYHSFIKCILSNGTLIMQTFFAMSGFLLSITFAEQEKNQKKQNYLGKFINFIVLRFIRLTPIYALSILFASTWFSKLGTGPFWNHVSQPEKVFCKKYWWTNLLYINNYFAPDQLCLAQAWYLGVDFQLFVISILLLMFLSRFPRSKIYVYIVGYLVSILLIIITFYRVDFQGLYFPTPEFARYAIVFDIYFKKFFIPGHTNIGGYLSGIVFGKIYLDLIERNYKLGENKKYIFTWYAIIPLGFVIILTAEYFYIGDSKEKTLLMALYLAITKNLYGFISGALLLGMCFKIGWIGYEFASLPMFRIPGRLTYCAFIIHLFLIRLPSIEFYQPIQLSAMLLINQIIGKLVGTYFISFFVALFIEFPISSIMKIIMMGAGGEKKKPNIGEINGNTHIVTKIDKTMI